MEDINSIQGHSELGRMEREYDAEYYDQTNENDTYNYNNTEAQDENAGLLSHFTNYIGGNSRHTQNLHSNSHNHALLNNTDYSFTNDNTSFHKSKIQKNKIKNFYKNKSSSHIKNHIITPTHFLNVQSPRPINNADDFIMLDAINDSQDERFTDYVKIGTINIYTGFNNKLDTIIEYFIYYNYNILIIMETGLFEDQKNDKIQKLPHSTLQNDYLYIVHDRTGDNKGSGIAAVMDSFFYRHLISNTRTYGQILHLKFGFKQHVFFHLIGVYLPASVTKNNATLRQDCYNYINKILLSNKPQDHHLILRDFNPTSSKKKNQNSSNPIDNIIPLIKQFQFKDVVKHFNSSPPATHIVNRINYIFTSSNLLPHTYHAFTHTINEHQFFYTDHKLVGCLINKFFFTTKPVTLTYSKLNDIPSSDKINYRNITANTWNEYEQNSNTAFNIPLPDIKSQEDLDQAWSHFVNLIDDLKSILPKKKSPQNPYTQNNNPTISSFTIPKRITLDNFEPTKKYLKQLLQILRFNYNTIKNEITKNNIEYFVEACNNNLTENQSKMLYSILNRQPRTIKLTKLQYIDENNVTTFTTDPDKIESLTCQHFQSYASSVHSTHYTSPNDLPSP
ncbi:hypothetical protein RclHR1_01120013 [Rhizophagus clarus]|uniref:Endonuclease/exonuclease/phosphatase domain-containing protein n=1 Tax=Rhizophagus clarus TaxID=94130 RepID=A0A2Z6Q570_9GLOM|nr:hypothetical protein RclHR1_01120013 [Rhizophagus clarus]